MILIDLEDVQGSGGNLVDFKWTEKVKAAKCSCGNQWTPTGVNDYKCEKCEDDKDGK